MIDHDGICGRDTIDAIRNFQTKMFGATDGRVDVGGRSFSKLLEIWNEPRLNRPKSYVRPDPKLQKPGIPVYKVTIGEDGRLFVQQDDWLSKYSAAIHGDYCGIHEFGRFIDGQVKPIVTNPDQIRAGETLYHIPTYNSFMGSKNKNPPVVPEMSIDTKRRVTKQALQRDFKVHGKVTMPVLEKVSEIVGYGGPVVEVASIAVRSLEGVATVLAPIAVFFTTFDMLINFVNNSTMDQQMYSLRSMAYGATAYIFGDGRQTGSRLHKARLLSQSSNRVQLSAMLDAVWEQSYPGIQRIQKDMAREYFKEVTNPNFTEEMMISSWKELLSNTTGKRKDAFAEMLMEELAKRFMRAGAVRDTFLLSVRDIRYPN